MAHFYQWSSPNARSQWRASSCFGKAGGHGNGFRSEIGAKVFDSPRSHRIFECDPESLTAVKTSERMMDVKEAGLFARAGAWGLVSVVVLGLPTMACAQNQNLERN